MDDVILESMPASADYRYSNERRPKKHKMQKGVGQVAVGVATSLKSVSKQFG